MLLEQGVPDSYIEGLGAEGLERPSSNCAFNRFLISGGHPNLIQVQKSSAKFSFLIRPGIGVILSCTLR